MEHLTEFEAVDIIIALSLIGLAIWLSHGYLVSKRRRQLMKEPLKQDWRAIVERNVPLYTKLQESDKKQLQGLINVFLDEKRFEGCGGLEITDEIKVTIAAQACMLLLNRGTSFYPKLKFILVYPSAYVAESITPVAGGVYVRNSNQARLGESWLRGSLVLAWDHVRMQGRDIHDGHNVVLHEFAHQLDQEDGVADGTPILEQRSNYVAWGRVFAHDYELLRYEVDHHVRDVMDAYGATNPAEFFAVATETFYEKPKQLKEKHPELYDRLKHYYKLDPVNWN